MYSDYDRAVLDSHRHFAESVFGGWLVERLRKKMVYHSSRLVSADTWDEAKKYQVAIKEIEQVLSMLEDPALFINSNNESED